MIVTITSAGGGVGKTSITIALAEEATNRGLKTCIADLDLSPGSLHPIYGLSRHKSTNEANENPDKVLEYIQKPEGKKFYILSGGLPDKVDTLNKEKIEVMLQILNKEFDLVLVDTASQTSESSITSIKLSDTTMFVITPEDYIGIRGEILIDFIKKFNLANINKFEAIINNRRPGKVKYQNAIRIPISLAIPFVKKQITPEKAVIRPYITPLIDIWFPNTVTEKPSLIKRIFKGVG